MTAGSPDEDRAQCLRRAIRSHILADETETVRQLIDATGLEPAERAAITAEATDLVRIVRKRGESGIMQGFLAEYGLSSREGIALMCLAEALLRVPDTDTIDALIADKIAPGDWGRHLGHSASSLVNASTWALLLTGQVLAREEGDSLTDSLHGVIRRLGGPVVRAAVGHAMRELGEQFVLGATIEEAIERSSALEEKGYTYSYDMLGEAARTRNDAAGYHSAYADAIAALAPHAKGTDTRANPGISVKLSALHPRYEFAQAVTARREIADSVLTLARQARAVGMGFSIDAEEADRLDLSLDIIEAVLADDALAGWDGFGIVVQAYGKRAPFVLDWIYDLAGRVDRRIAVRLVKGAYWDSEIKRAQVLGLSGYPVFTRKAATDVSYLACARRLLGMNDRIYPQFATHNAHTLSAIVHLAGDGQDFEFQRLHGMGDALHESVRKRRRTRCRIYAPVGAYEDLLAYLVRRLLENGANSSFVHQIVDTDVPPETVARDPIAVLEAGGAIPNPAIAAPRDIHGGVRIAAMGWDLTDPDTIAALDAARAPFRAATWRAAPMIAAPVSAAGTERDVRNPARLNDIVGTVEDSSAAHIAAAFDAAGSAFPQWSNCPVADRATCLDRIADLYEFHAPELLAMMAREAGKTMPDGVAEVREAVDFCRYYAAEARHAASADTGGGRGVFVCISPWNFPLAIFTGQIAAALVTGNTVLAKPAEQTPLIAARAVALMHAAGVPPGAVQLLPGDGPGVGAALVSDPRIAGVCFTGSTAVAQSINRAMAAHADPRAPLVAETGGINAMIVDSTALPEQAVRDIVASAFQSAGQRCSALRVLYLQQDVAGRIIDMLDGAIDCLIVGDPWDLSTDVGPVIDSAARDAIHDHCATMTRAGHLIARLNVPEDLDDGLFVAPEVQRVTGIDDIEREVFGPVLHVATYEAAHLDDVIAAINRRGFGLTFGLHSRVDDRVQRAVERLRAGNIYVNRNQIGAVVGVQPFGGEGLSGTGPKAGGPHYLRRFRPLTGEPGDFPAAFSRQATVSTNHLVQAFQGLDGDGWAARPDRTGVLRGQLSGLDGPLVQSGEAALARCEATIHAPRELCGPTGESNRLSLHPRGPVLCLGNVDGNNALAVAVEQAVMALAAGNAVVIAVPGGETIAGLLSGDAIPVQGLDASVAPQSLDSLAELAAVAATGKAERLRPFRIALASREGPILPLITDADPISYVVERVVSVDTTAAGGNASLLSDAGS